MFPRFGGCCGVAALALGAAACAGQLANLRLAPAEPLMTVSIASLDRTAAFLERQVVFSIFGVSTESTAFVATDRPVAIAVTAQGSAVAFSLRDPATAAEWLARLGQLQERSGNFALVAPLPSFKHGIFSDLPPTTALWIHRDGPDVMVANTRAALAAAGPVAQAARRPTADIQLDLPAGLDPSRLVAPLARLLAFTRGAPHPNPLTPLTLPPLLHPLQGTRSLLLHATPASLSLQVAGTSAQVAGTSAQVAGTSPQVAGTSAQVAGTSPQVAGTSAQVAAVGGVPCGMVFGGRRAVVGRWRGTGGVGVEELGRLLEVEERAVETCGFVVGSAGEVWSEEERYGLRAGADGGELREALLGAIRSGGLPNLQSALEDLDSASMARFLFSQKDGVLAVDRVLGPMTLRETRYAAALAGGGILQDRYAVAGGHLVAVSGARADERVLARSPWPSPPELVQALAGRGRQGYVFLDLTALWAPFLRAAQVIQSPVADLLVRAPGLLKGRRPLVVTLDPGLVTVTMPPETARFLVKVAGTFFGL